MAKDKNGLRELPEKAAEDRPPPFGQPVPLDAGGPLPRVIRGAGKQPAGNYRAPAGTSRFKVRARTRPDLDILYILAKKGDQAAAEKCYLEATGLAGEHRKACELAAKAKQDPPAEPELVVTELPD